MISLQVWGFTARWCTIYTEDLFWKEVPSIPGIVLEHVLQWRQTKIISHKIMLDLEDHCKCINGLQLTYVWNPVRYFCQKGDQMALLWKTFSWFMFEGEALLHIEVVQVRVNVSIV